MLLAVDGSQVEVLSSRRYSSTDQTAVWLETDAFTVALTHNHRVMVLRGLAQRQTMPAGHLRIGDLVLTANGHQEIKDVKPFINEDDVFELTFAPDSEMETFFIEKDESGSLLTKGKKTPIANRRGGMNKSAASKMTLGSDPFVPLEMHTAESSKTRKRLKDKTSVSSSSIMPKAGSPELTSISEAERKTVENNAKEEVIEESGPGDEDDS